MYRRSESLCILHVVAERIPNEKTGFILAIKIREKRGLKNPKKRGIAKTKSWKEEVE
jgi:hypothetical protein